MWAQLGPHHIIQVTRPTFGDATWTQTDWNSASCVDATQTRIYWALRSCWKIVALSVNDIFKDKLKILSPWTPWTHEVRMILVTIIRNLKNWEWEKRELKNTCVESRKRQWTGQHAWYITPPPPLLLPFTPSVLTFQSPGPETRN